MKIITGRKGAAGTVLELQGGGPGEVRDAPAAGTSVEVKDLFFNTPARRKFLKTDSTELFHIIDAVTKEGLANPETAFSLVVDNHETVRLAKAAGLRERLMQLYGEEFLAGLTETAAAGEGLGMQAFISHGSSFRNTRSHQFVFLNGRPIKDQSISHAVYRSYEGILPPDKHPLYFIYLRLDPRKVDFNVHPTKREVRFEDKETVYRFILSHLRDAVKQEHRGYVQEFSLPAADDRDSSAQTFTGQLPAQSPPGTIPAVSENLEFAYRPSLPFIYLGGTFIAVSGRGGLMIIDHHAAHERILFERLLNSGESSSRQLLFTRQVQVTEKEYLLLIRNRELLQTLGFEIDEFGKNTVLVRSAPAEIADADIAGILPDIAAGFLDEHTAARPLRYDLAARIACHSSVRGRKILSADEVSRLLEDLERTEHPDQCPHGRPTRIFYSLHDLDKLFRRK